MAKTERKTPTRTGKTQQTSMRLEHSLLAEIDAIRDQLRADTGLSVQRTDVVRVLLREALAARAALRCA